MNFLSQFNNNPGEPQWTAAKRILGFLKDSQDQGFIYKHDAESIIAFVDADWASDVNDRKSYTEYVFKYAGGAISWESRRELLRYLLPNLSVWLYQKQLKRFYISDGS